jgi:polyisoprenoid-binding protein YceI
MRKYHSTLNRAAMVALLMFCGTSASAEPADWEIDPEHFSIAFEAKHVGYQQQMGFFLEASGSFRYDIETRELSSEHLLQP